MRPFIVTEHFNRPGIKTHPDPDIGLENERGFPGKIMGQFDHQGEGGTLQHAQIERGFPPSAAY